MNEIPNTDKFAPLTAEELADLPATPHDEEKGVWEPIIPVPDAVQRIAFSGVALRYIAWEIGGKWEQPDMRWPYFDSEGRLLGFAVRWNPATEGRRWEA